MASPTATASGAPPNLAPNSLGPTGSSPPTSYFQPDESCRSSTTSLWTCGPPTSYRAHASKYLHHSLPLKIILPQQMLLPCFSWSWPTHGSTAGESKIESCPFFLLCLEECSRASPPQTIEKVFLRFSPVYHSLCCLVRALWQAASPRHKISFCGEQHRWCMMASVFSRGFHTSSQNHPNLFPAKTETCLRVALVLQARARRQHTSIAPDFLTPIPFYSHVAFPTSLFMFSMRFQATLCTTCHPGTRG